MVRWLGLRTPTIGGPGSIPGGGTKIPKTPTPPHPCTREKKTHLCRSNSNTVSLLSVGFLHTSGPYGKLFVVLILLIVMERLKVTFCII